MLGASQAVVGTSGGSAFYALKVLSEASTFIVWTRLHGHNGRWLCLNSMQLSHRLHELSRHRSQTKSYVEMRSRPRSGSSKLIPGSTMTTSR